MTTATNSSKVTPAKRYQPYRTCKSKTIISSSSTNTPPVLRADHAEKLKLRAAFARLKLDNHILAAQLSEAHIEPEVDVRALPFDL